MPDWPIRPLNLQTDLDAMLALIEAAFADDIARRDLDLRRELQTVKRWLPILLFFGRFFSELRNVFDGFVWEEDGRLAGLVVAQKMGSDRTRWLIGTVATHPDYRRRGIARRLVERAVTHAAGRGAQACVLDVAANNLPAYNLYRNLGFVHYDSTVDLKLAGLTPVKVQPAAGYQLYPMPPADWPARYELATRATPPEVQAFLPVNRAEYRITPIGRMLTPLLLRLQRLDAHAWAAEQNGRLLGTLRVLASRVEKRNHGLTVMIDPLHSRALAELLLTRALDVLQKYPRGNTTTSIRLSETHLRNLFSAYGFEEIETTHRLGKKLAAAPYGKHTASPALS